ncbi:retrovirus-related pol polyprotein from transposon TNT 1-94 [Tanacetum coccineum]
MSGTHKGVGIHENLVDMVKKNKLDTDNKRLKGRDLTDKDVEKSNKMVNKIDEILRNREQLRRLEEYVGGRPKTVNPRTFPSYMVTLMKTFYDTTRFSVSWDKKENIVWQVERKSCKGFLKQAPRQWYLKFDSFMHKAWYKRCVMDHCYYLKKVGLSSIILLLYVDDMLVAGSDMVEIKKLKRQLSQEFEMKDLGSAKQILGMSIIRDKTKCTLRLSQEKYIGKLMQIEYKNKPHNTRTNLKFSKREILLFNKVVGFSKAARENPKIILIKEDKF